MAKAVETVLILGAKERVEANNRNEEERNEHGEEGKRREERYSDGLRERKEKQVDRGVDCVQESIWRKESEKVR